MKIIGWKYITNKLHFEVVNSWGTDWGKDGTFYVSWDHLFENFHDQKQEDKYDAEKFIYHATILECEYQVSILL